MKKQNYTECSRYNRWMKLIDQQKQSVQEIIL